MYKVFINDLCLIILSKSESDYKLLWPNARFIDGAEIDPKTLLSEAETSTISHLVVVTANAEKFFDSFCRLFTIVEAAGGIVNLDNRKGPFLLIYRRGKWDLPKGKIDAGESHEEAALREVTEECGINKLVIRSRYDTLYHTYSQKGIKYLKITYWFHMISTDQNEPKPQNEEGIEKVKWANNEELPFLLKDSYHSIRDLMAPLING